MHPAVSTNEGRLGDANGRLKSACDCCQGKYILNGTDACRDKNYTLVSMLLLQMWMCWFSTKQHTVDVSLLQTKFSDWQNEIQDANDFDTKRWMTPIHTVTTILLSITAYWYDVVNAR